MNWNSRRVLVTGATGLVGSWLVKRLLTEGSYTVAFVRDADPQSELLRSGDINRVSVVNGNLEEYADVARAIVDHDIDTVFHLGAQTIVGAALRNPLQTFESNIRGTYNLLEACRLHGVNCTVVASSDKAYGHCETLPYDESMPLNGRHPYDVSKSCTDLLAATYSHTYGLPVVIARCGNIYGGGDLNWSRIVPGTIKSLLAGEAPVIRSDGSFKRDYVYVKDAANVYVRLAEGLFAEQSLAGEAFNFGPSKPLSVIEIVDLIRKLMDREDLEPVVRNEAKSEIRDQFLASSKAERILGIKPDTTLNDGLAETVAWYRLLLGEVA